MITLQKFTINYIPYLLKWFANKNNRKYMHTQTITLSGAKKLIASNKNKKCYIIKKDHTPIGYCMLKDINTYPKIGIMIDEKYQSLGFGYKAMKLLHKKAIKYKCKNIGLMVHIKNKKAINLYKKLGYEQTHYIMNKQLD